MRFNCTGQFTDRVILSYEETCERFPWFSAVIPDEEYAEFNEFETVTLTISRMTFVIRKHEEGVRDGKSQGTS